ncbi:carboxymuconolactone decarboxylase family protein [Epidermidibacterium keratini]|uniref:Carboxymuconolactone decarboxylase family protein n=1 Tax=Epidermidibacterium keratini TaxID=1891644 RepID=A0A7L4YPL1_9ACTN|nr:carboxymuconolactone decarboxylase family protein [Epidermidibacterium keratini]QHC00497.1 carboxymuconolactone decarboxylase family protein [Epidermidibacterium keratini]
MPRLRRLAKSEVTDEFTLKMYGELFGDRDPVAEPGTETGTPGDWWTVFALVPDVLRHFVDAYAMYHNPRRVIDPILRELGQTRAAWNLSSAFVYSQHVKALRAYGVSDDRIAAISSWSTSTDFSAPERAVLAYTDALTLEQGRVADGTFAALKAELSDEAILELTYILAYYGASATISKALRLEYDDRPDPIAEVPGGPYPLPGEEGYIPPTVEPDSEGKDR